MGASIQPMGKPVDPPNPDLPTQEIVMSEEQKLKLADLEASFDDAFAAAQANFAPIHRSRTVRVALKTGGSYEFAYAPLEVILKATIPALNAQGISLSQHIRIALDGDHPDHFLVTTLKRKGWSEESEVLIFRGEASPQAYGSAVTYAKRMGASLALGVAVEDDNDGSDASLSSPPGDRSARRQKAQAAAVDAGAKIVPPPKKEPTYTPQQIADLEGKLVDAKQEMLEACAEGRRVGIMQIWGEVKGNEYIATRLWNDIKREYPDYFKTMEETLKPKEKAARGPAAA